MTWQEFRADLAKLGYEIGFGDPGPGAVLSFDPGSKGFVLTTEANWPQEFVEPIRAWIAGHERVGQCIVSACTKCGRDIYAPQSVSQPLCRDCRPETTTNQRG